MSRYLSNALEISDPKFRFSLRDLEKANGSPNHDIKLENEIAQNLSRKIEQLGLDPTDTNQDELYAASLHKLAEADNNLTKQIRTLAGQNVNAAANIEDGLLELLHNQFKNHDVISLKTKFLKNYFKSHPPKAVMKRLDFRSVDSLLKRSNPALVLVAINSLESPTYLNNFYHSYNKLKPSDFETGKLKFINAPNAKWREFLQEVEDRTKLNFISSFELSSLIIFPIDNNLKSGQLTSILSMAIEEVNELKILSSYIKLSQVNKDFAKRVTALSSNLPQTEMSLLGTNISYPLAMRFMNDLKLEVEHPLINKSDLSLSIVTEKICELFKDFSFFIDNELLAHVDKNHVTSLHLQDVAYNLSHDLKLDQASSFFFKRALKNELIKRYIKKEELQNNFNKQIEPTFSLVD